MADKPSFYITTAISYPNGVPHIGHAYEAISTDAFARFKRLDGHNVFFLTGTDEHGIKMFQTARKEGITAQELADKNSAAFQEMAKTVGCTNDDFIRTSEPRHHKAAQDIWKRMKESDDIYFDRYAGWYSVRDEAYYDEKEITKNEEGVKLSPQGTPVEWVEEESYFFRLSKYEDKLLAHYEENPDFIGPDARRNEVTSFVKGGLKDLSVSRTTFDWGIKVPDDEKHVMYVWVDALTNYLTGTGYPDENADRAHFWPADLHIIGKDIIRFHAVYWPAFLMSAGLPLPKRVFAHGFLFNKGEKMSKSTGNVVGPEDMIDTYGLDATRYFLLREVPYGKDGSYSHEAIVNRINADLANDIGNLAQRSLSMIAKNCDGALPEPGEFTEADKTILAATDALLEPVRSAMDEQAIHKAIEMIWNVVADANRYFAGEEPWALKKTDPARMGTVLYVTAEVIRQIAVLAQFVTPTSAGKFLDALGVDENSRDFTALGETGRLSPGTAIPKPEPIFPRYVEEEKDA